MSITACAHPQLPKCPRLQTRKLNKCLAHKEAANPLLTQLCQLRRPVWQLAHCEAEHLQGWQVKHVMGQAGEGVEGRLQFDQRAQRAKAWQNGQRR